MKRKRYTLEDLYRKGVISASVVRYRDINNKLAQLEAQGTKPGAAVRKIARDLNITVQTVYNAKKSGLK